MYWKEEADSRGTVRISAPSHLEGAVTRLSSLEETGRQVGCHMPVKAQVCISVQLYQLSSTCHTVPSLKVYASTVLVYSQNCAFITTLNFITFSFQKSCIPFSFSSSSPPTAHLFTATTLLPTDLPIQDILFKQIRTRWDPLDFFHFDWLICKIQPYCSMYQ